MRWLLFLSIILLFSTGSILFAQNPEWINYTNGDYISALEFEGDVVWIGTWGGIVKYNRTTGETSFYNKLNSDLPHNHISCIAVDSSGNKWIGTNPYTEQDPALVKYDGANWTVYQTHNKEVITCITADISGKIWIGTRGAGLANFDGIEGTVYSTPSLGKINCIEIDNSGIMWIGSEPIWSSIERDNVGGGLAIFDGTNWEIYNTSNSEMPGNSVLCISIDNEGNKWIGTDQEWSSNVMDYIGGGLAKFDDTSWTVYTFSNSALPCNYVENISIDNSGNKWIATQGTWDYYPIYIEKALLQFDDTNWTLYGTEYTGFHGNNTSVLRFDEKNNLWIGNYSYAGGGNVSGHGLYTFDETNWTKINTSSSGLTDNYIESVEIDNDGNKWISTGFKGLVKFDNVNWTVFDSTNSGLPNGIARCIEADNSGNMWFGTHQGLIRFDGANWTVYDTTNSGLPRNSIFGIAIDQSGNKWIGAGSEGLVKFDGIEWTVYNETNSEIPLSYVFDLEIDIDGSIWLTSWSEGLAKFDGIDWTHYTGGNSGLPSSEIYSFAIDEKGNKWAGCLHKGVAKFDNTNWTVYNEANSGLPDNYVHSIAIDNSGNKWIGTWEGGLAKFNDTTWTVYNTSNSGLASDLIHCITVDRYDNIWIGTPWNGLYVFKEGGVITNVVEDFEQNTQPQNYVLYQNYPNPFNPTTTINYSIPSNAKSPPGRGRPEGGGGLLPVELVVYNILGKEVATLVKEQQRPGNYEVKWDAAGHVSGVYFYKLETGSFLETKKMLLLK